MNSYNSYEYQIGWSQGYFQAMNELQENRKKGKWTEKEVIHAEEAKETITEWQSCKCSACGRYHTQPYLYYFAEPHFCSWCGAEMEKGEDDAETD